MSRSSSRLIRAAAVSASLLFLVALVGLAAGNERPLPGTGPTRAARLDPAIDAVFTIGITVYAVLLVFTIWVLWPSRGRDLGPGPVDHRRTLVAFMLGLLVVWLLFMFKIERMQEIQEALENWVQQGEARRRAAEAQSSKTAVEAVDFRWPIALLVMLIVFGAATIAFLRRRRDAPAAALPDLALEEELAQVVEATLGTLHVEDDPRRAVIAAYAQMERVLGAHGHPRRHYEAPFEYLARILQELRVRASAALALTELFERARFSTHDVDEDMKREAIGALEAVRADLRATG